jgi:hypothetical protein
MRHGAQRYAQVFLTRYPQSVGDLAFLNGDDAQTGKDYSQYIDLASQAVTGLFGGIKAKKEAKAQQKMLEEQAKIAAIQAQQQMQAAMLRAQQDEKASARRMKAIGVGVATLGVIGVIGVIAWAATRAK